MMATTEAIVLGAIATGSLYREYAADPTPGTLSRYLHGMAVFRFAVLRAVVVDRLDIGKVGPILTQRGGTVR